MLPVRSNRIGAEFLKVDTVRADDFIARAQAGQVCPAARLSLAL